MFESHFSYSEVFGDIWSSHKSDASCHRSQAGRRQLRSYRHSGRPSVKNMVTASAKLPSAVFKRIRAGGCSDKQGLMRQLAYVNDKAAAVFSSGLLVDERLSGDEKQGIVESWASSWRGAPKNGHTSHMLLSFPPDSGEQTVAAIANKFCQHFFDEGLYGDRWDYVLAIHTDRSHPHAHILLNNRGIDRGLWFTCYAEGAMSPQLMREKQAEIAGEHGIYLHATTRLERGIFTKPPALEEIYQAKAEGRSARDVAMAPEEEARAKAVSRQFAEEYYLISQFFDRFDLPCSVKALVGAAGALWYGQGLPQPAAPDQLMQELPRALAVGHNVAMANSRFDRLLERAEALRGAERAAFEVESLEFRKTFSRYDLDPNIHRALTTDLGFQFPGVIPEEDGDRFAQGTMRSYALERLTELATRIGLDPAEHVERYAQGGTSNYELGTRWIDRDIERIVAVARLHTPEAHHEVLHLSARAALSLFNQELGAILRQHSSDPSQVQINTNTSNFLEAEAHAEAMGATTFSQMARALLGEKGLAQGPDGWQLVAEPQNVARMAQQIGMLRPGTAEGRERTTYLRNELIAEVQLCSRERARDELAEDYYTHGVDPVLGEMGEAELSDEPFEEAEEDQLSSEEEEEFDLRRVADLIALAALENPTRDDTARFLATLEELLGEDAMEDLERGNMDALNAFGDALEQRNLRAMFYYSFQQRDRSLDLDLDMEL